MSTASAARIAANKANAQRSTGPRTEAGKARVSENALKHGLRSERNPLDLATDSALPIEREEFETTLAAFLADLQPQGPIETRLVERLAQIDLRLQRAVRMETTHLEFKFAETLADATKAGSSLATATDHHRDNILLTFAFLRDPAALKLIGQYESRLARDFSRTLTQLRAAQKLRIQTQSANAQNLREQTQSAPVGTEPATTDTSENTPEARTTTHQASASNTQPCSLSTGIERPQTPSNDPTKQTQSASQCGSNGTIAA